MTGRQFIDVSTNKVVKVIDSFEDIAILEGNAKTRASRLLDPNYFEPYIDPSSFFKSDAHLNKFAEMIKQIPTEGIRDDESIVSVGSDGFRVTDEPAVIPYDPEEEKRELMRKYNIPQQNAELVRQNEAFAKLLDEEPMRVDVDRETDYVQQAQQPQQPQEQVRTVVVERNDDPITMMFRNCKRTLEFKLDLSVNEKIPRTDFIEMMEDSYSTSIIDYLAEEFTDKLLSDPSEIKRRIKDEIMKLVYPKKVQTKSTKPATKTTAKTDTKTQTKAKTTSTKPVTRVRKTKQTTDEDRS